MSTTWSENARSPSWETTLGVLNARLLIAACVGSLCLGTLVPHLLVDCIRFFVQFLGPSLTILSFLGISLSFLGSLALNISVSTSMDSFYTLLMLLLIVELLGALFDHLPLFILSPPEVWRNWRFTRLYWENSWSVSSCRYLSVWSLEGLAWYSLTLLELMISKLR